MNMHVPTGPLPKVKLPAGRKGPWVIERFTIPKRPTLEGLRCLWDGRPTYPGTYTRLLYNGKVMMSDTRAEMLDHREFVRIARDHVLISGLGLGMCLAAVLEKKEVKKVTVVEIDQDLIDLVWPHFKANKKAELIKANIIEWKPPKGVHYGAVWHDIWISNGPEAMAQSKTLKLRYNRISDWCDSWVSHISRVYR